LWGFQWYKSRYLQVYH